MNEPLHPRPPKPNNSDESIPQEGNIPAASQQKSSEVNYTLDEMMKALRESERQKDEQGKIVTRTDGTVARRVRRRKRRSEQAQPKQREETKRKKSSLFKAMIGVSAFLFLLMAGLLVLLVFNSDGYEEKIVERVKNWTGAENKLSQLKVLPGQVSATRMVMSWPENSYLESLNLRKIEGDLTFTTLLGGKMGGQGIGGKQGALVVRAGDKAGDIIPQLKPSEYPFNFNRYYCSNLDVRFGDSDFLSLKGTEASLRHLTGEGFQVSLSGGSFGLKGWQDFVMDNALIRFPAEGIQLATLRVRPRNTSIGDTSDSLKISGTIPLKRGEKSQLVVQTTGFPFEELAGKDLGSFFTGSIRQTDGLANYTMGNVTLDEVIFANFKGDGFQMYRFPMIENLQKIIYGGLDQKIVFDSSADGTFRWTPKGVIFEDFALSNKNLRMEGSIVISASGKIRGQVRLWLSMGFINGNPQFENHPAFKKREGEGSGYAVIDVNLMGTTKLPDDDFRLTTGLDRSLGIEKSNGIKQAADLWKIIEEGE